MKISMVSTQSRSGGQSIHVKGLAAELARNGHDVAVTMSERPERDALRSVGGLADHMARAWRDIRPDIVHAHGWLGGLVALAALNDPDGVGAAGTSHIPVVVSFHGLAHAARHNGDAVLPERARFERAAGRTADAVVALSEEESEDLIRLGVRRGRVSVIPGGVDASLFCPEGPALPRGEAHRIAVAARPTPGKGIDTLIRSLARVPDAEVVIAGGPPSEELDSDDEIHRLRIVATEAGVADRVLFLGRLPHQEVPRLLRSADLTVSLPAAEPFGRVPVESMACGTPVVVSPVGGNLETVLDEVTGAVLSPHRPGGLAKGLRTLLAEPTHREALGIAGIDRARSRYGWDRIARETLKAYAHARHE
jgi:glycosyltransferase involved in cell wall biosynthesis